MLNGQQQQDACQGDEQAHDENSPSRTVRDQDLQQERARTRRGSRPALLVLGLGCTRTADARVLLCGQQAVVVRVLSLARTCPRRDWAMRLLMRPRARVPVLPFLAPGAS